MLYVQSNLRHDFVPLRLYERCGFPAIRCAQPGCMLRFASEVTLADVVCLTEPRVVDAMFDRTVAILSTGPDQTSLRYKHMIGYNILFAAILLDTMGALTYSPCGCGYYRRCQFTSARFGVAIGLPPIA